MLSFIYKFHFILYSVIQWDKERETKSLRESQREKPWGRAGLLEEATSTAHRSRGTGAEQWADDRSTVYRSTMSISDLRWGATRRAMMRMTSSLRWRRRRRDRPWVTGFGFGLCIGDFFFINTSMLCVWFAEFCVWFAFVLGFDLFASDDLTWWDSAKR